MSATALCDAGHRHDAAWPSCPYCEPVDAAEPLLPLGWLVVLSGERAGLDIRLEREPRVLGSSDRADLRLDDDTVSGRHARLEGINGPDGWRLLITDLGSTNGTFIDADPAPIDQAEVRDGAELTFGSTRARFRAF